MTNIVRQIPLKGSDRYLELVRPESGEWELRENDGGKIRPLNSYENRFVNSTYAAVWNGRTVHLLEQQVAIEKKVNDCLGRMVDERLAAVDKVASLAGLAVQNHDVSEYDLGLANGLLMALSTLRGNEYTALTRPTFWRGVKPTLREHYREYRKTEKPIPAAFLAFFKWAD